VLAILMKERVDEVLGGNVLGQSERRNPTFPVLVQSTCPIGCVGQAGFFEIGAGEPHLAARPEYPPELAKKGDQLIEQIEVLHDVLADDHVE
jgi:hypothetical protein